jgi:RNA polymerase sigma factor (sigma-70 family)
MQEALFNQLISENTTALRNFALRFTTDSEQINDLCQDTLMKAIRYFDKFNEGTNFKAWLFTIMRNTYINEYRRDTRKNKLITTEDEISSANLMHSSTANNAEAGFVMGDVQRTLAQLPDSYRIPFTRYFEGYKYHEIAIELSIPIGTVKTRIHMARGILQKKLKGYKLGRN